VVGEAPAGEGPVRRSGARPGDLLFVTGTLGGSIHGRHLRFRPRQDEALELVRERTVTAMIDLSDGLSSDAAHIARESGVRILVDAASVPVSEEVARGSEPLRHALNDGEDFELLFTVPADHAAGLAEAGLAGTPVTRIGRVAAGSPGVFLVVGEDREEPLADGGFEHFR
jgi:thiamine-monophosphate kinase